MAMAAPMLLNQEKYGPWAIVAGASEGTGACFAHEIAAAGINLLLIARRAGPLEAIAEDIRRDHGVEVRTLRSEEHTSELQSLMRISYAVFCLKKKNKRIPAK